MAGAAPVITRMEVPPIPGCRQSSGCYSRMLTLATSPGNSMRRTSDGSRKTPVRTEPIAARVRRAKVQHCCKAWWFVGYAGAG